MRPTANKLNTYVDKNFQPTEACMHVSIYILLMLKEFGKACVLFGWRLGWLVELWITRSCGCKFIACYTDFSLTFAKYYSIFYCTISSSAVYTSGIYSLQYPQLALSTSSIYSRISFCFKNRLLKWFLCPWYVLPISRVFHVHVCVT